MTRRRETDRSDRRSAPGPRSHRRRVSAAALTVSSDRRLQYQLPAPSRRQGVRTFIDSGFHFVVKAVPLCCPRTYQPASSCSSRPTGVRIMYIMLNIDCARLPCRPAKCRASHRPPGTLFHLDRGSLSTAATIFTRRSACSAEYARRMQKVDQSPSKKSTAYGPHFRRLHREACTHVRETPPSPLGYTWRSGDISILLVFGNHCELSPPFIETTRVYGRSVSSQFRRPRILCRISASGLHSLAPDPRIIRNSLGKIRDACRAA